ncbi:MAG: inositol monophosphatase family protein [Christensenellales bacterium]|jgi:myo-inositol-1(or 4)-monophosphatase|nr:inositol monophosphatase [Clostridiales bacterium]
MLHQLENIIKEAAQIMVNKTPEGIITKEGHANFVTEADQATQDFLQEKLLALLPGSVLFGEEKENEPLTNAPTWVVDPIDGTLNYIHGLKHSAVSIALVRDKQVQLACIYNPYRDELFTAQLGKGAWLNGQPIRCSDTPFERALVFYGTSPYNASLVDATFRAVASLMKKTADIRRFGSAVLDLAYIACGRADLFFEYSLSPWDYAAGKLVVTEAGGVFKTLNFTGDALDFSAPAAVFVSNPACEEAGFPIVQKEYAAWQAQRR